MSLVTRKILLAVSLSGDASSRRSWDHLQAAADNAYRQIAGEEAPLRVCAAPGLLLLATPGVDHGSDTGVVVPLSLGPRTQDGVHLEPTAIAARVFSGACADLAPPFAACALEQRAASLCIANDGLGLRHVYGVQQRGWAAVSTSSMLLARLTNAELDGEAIGAYALVGNYLGDRTPFGGVCVLPAGAVARLAHGRLEVEPPPTHPRPDRELRGAAAIAAGAQTVRQVVKGCLHAYPRPALELSGGLDSRMLLAAIPPDSRRGLHAITIGPAGSEDHRIAAGLARRYGLDHHAVRSDELQSAAPEELLSLASSAAYARDCSGNPTALAVLDWQERRLDQRPRIGGQNGEFARGFYYPGHRVQPRTTDQLIDVLARWRVFTNDNVDPALFTGGFLHAVQESVMRDMRQEIKGYDLPWLAATDEFYLRQRMRRWAGIAYSAACTRRVVQCPFLHQPFLMWARACDPSEKRGSKLFAAVLASLDEELAAMPLDSGRSPRSIARPSALGRLRTARSDAWKVLRKVEQRLRQQGRPPTGAATVAAAIQVAWSQQDEALGPLLRLPFLNPRSVEEAATGRRLLDPASVGLLLNLDVALRAVRSEPVSLPARSA